MEQLGHVIPKSTLVATYVGLVALTLMMIGLSRIQVDHIAIDWIDLHTVKAVVIMGIALVMGIIVAMFLMGLRYEVKLLNLTIFLTNFVFLLIFVAFTWADTSFRAEIDPSFAQEINFESPVKPGEATHNAHNQHGSTSDMEGAGGVQTGQGQGIPGASVTGHSSASAPVAGSDTGASRGATGSDTAKQAPAATAPAKPKP